MARTRTAAVARTRAAAAGNGADWPPTPPPGRAAAFRCPKFARVRPTTIIVPLQPAAQPIDSLHCTFRESKKLTRSNTMRSLFSIGNAILVSRSLI